MRTSAALLLVAATAWIGPGGGTALARRWGAAGQEARPQVSWPDAPPLATPFPAPDTAPPPLPAASIAEPFAIGEALYDPGRADQAVMSLLALMRIGVAAAPAPSAAAALTLDESEVRTLIALAVEDLRSVDDIEDLPFGFADLHRAVAALLPQVTVEELAETYTQAYEAHPDDLVAKVMMGQPLEPDTRLTRAQIWLLLMDGFAGPGGAAAPYGTADRELPDLPSPNPAWSAAEWREALARLPLVAASRLLAVESADAAITLRLTPQPPPFLSRISGKPLFAARVGSLAGQEVTWEAADESALRELATLSTATGQPTRVAATGLARFAVKPTAAAAGPGELVQEWASVSAALPGGPLASSAYAIPQPLGALVLGARRVEAPIGLPWRTTDKVRVQITYRYALQLQTPIGGVRREGLDTADGWLVRRANGTYTGTMVGTIHADQQVRGSANCGNTTMSARQQLHVEGRMLPRGGEPGTGLRGGQLARTRDLGRYHWATPGATPLDFVLGATWERQPPADGYLVLEFFPKTAPATLAGAAIPADPGACLPLIEGTGEQRVHGVSHFIPFNDAQWTTPGAGYAIGLHRARDYYFVDDNNSTGALFGRVLDLSVVDASGGSGRPRWTVRVQRPSLAP